MTSKQKDKIRRAVADIHDSLPHPCRTNYPAASNLKAALRIFTALMEAYPVESDENRIPPHLRTAV